MGKKFKIYSLLNIIQFLDSLYCFVLTKIEVINCKSFKKLMIFIKNLKHLPKIYKSHLFFSIKHFFLLKYHSHFARYNTSLDN
jgi:hypothetical protein